MEDERGRKMGNVFAEEFGCTKAGENVTAFTLENDSGMKVRILDYGATIQREYTAL